MKTLVMLLALALTASTAAAEMYTWKDSKGTTFYTNSLHEIPARYIKRARVLDVATGKKGGPALASPGTPTAAPTAPGGAASSPPQAPHLVQSAPPPQPPLPAAVPVAAPTAPASPTAPAAAVTAPTPEAPPRAVSAVPQKRPAGVGRRALRRHNTSSDE